MMSRGDDKGFHRAMQPMMDGVRDALAQGTPMTVDEILKYNGEVCTSATESRWMTAILSLCASGEIACLGKKKVKMGRVSFEMDVFGLPPIWFDGDCDDECRCGLDPAGRAGALQDPCRPPSQIGGCTVRIGTPLV